MLAQRIDSVRVRHRVGGKHARAEVVAGAVRARRGQRHARQAGVKTASAAAVTNEMATRVRLVKENTFVFGGVQQEKTSQVISVYYDDLIQTLVNSMKDVFTKSKSLPRLGRPIPLVLSGGSTMPIGFRARFEQAMQAVEFPVPVSEIRLAGD